MKEKKRRSNSWLSDDEAKNIDAIKAQLNEEKDYAVLRARWD